MAIVLMYVRAFFGTELTDEAYYVAEAKEMLNGNVPFAINFSSKGIGFAFLSVVLIALYGCFVPSLAGVFLFIRLCFVTYKVLVWAVAYSVLKKKLRHSHALLISALIIPAMVGARECQTARLDHSAQRSDTEFQLQHHSRAYFFHGRLSAI